MIGGLLLCQSLLAAAAQRAVDSQVEECQVAMVLGQFKPNPDRPNMLRFQRPLLAQDAPLVPSRAKRANGRQVRCLHV